MSDDNGTGQANTDTGQEGSQAAEGSEQPGATGGDTGQPGGEGASQAAAGSEDKGGEGESSDQIPGSYEFTAPEGMEVDNALIEAVSPIFKDIGLTQDQASKLNAAYGEHMKSAGEASQTASQEAFETQIGEWETELKNDKDFGGDSFEANAAAVSQFIDKTAPPEILEALRDDFEQTGFGSKPAFVRYIHALSKRFPVGEDGPGGQTGGNKSTANMSKTERQASRSDRMYATD